MGVWKSRGRSAILGALILTLAGCTISIQPWSKPTPPAPGDPPPGHPYPPGAYSGTPPHPLPPNMAAVNESTTQLIQRLNETDDHRKALLDQVQALKKQLKERDENVRQASLEMDESTRSIKRTREEFRQWQSEMDDLRDRIRKLEEYRATIKPLVEEIIHQLDRESLAPKTLRLPITGN